MGKANNESLFITHEQKHGKHRIIDAEHVSETDLKNHYNDIQEKSRWCKIYNIKYKYYKYII